MQISTRLTGGEYAYFQHSLMCAQFTHRNLEICFILVFLGGHMQNQNIAIIGLNTVGTEFFRAMIDLKNKGVNVLGVSEKVFTEGAQLAQDMGVKNLSIEQIVDLGEDVDVIFDLSSDRDIRKDLRKTLFSSKNQHTVIAPESIARLMYTMIGNEPLPKSETENIGY